MRGGQSSTLFAPVSRAGNQVKRCVTERGLPKPVPTDAARGRHAIVQRDSGPRLPYLASKVAIGIYSQLSRSLRTRTKAHPGRLDHFWCDKLCSRGGESRARPAPDNAHVTLCIPTPHSSVCVRSQPPRRRRPPPPPVGRIEKYSPAPSPLSLSSFWPMTRITKSPHEMPNPLPVSARCAYFFPAPCLSPPSALRPPTRLRVRCSGRTAEKRRCNYASERLRAPARLLPLCGQLPLRAQVCGHLCGAYPLIFCRPGLSKRRRLLVVYVFLS